MAPWVRRVFIHILPRLLVMRRPQYHQEKHRLIGSKIKNGILTSCHDNFRDDHYYTVDHYNCRQTPSYRQTLDELAANGGCRIHGPALLADDLGMGVGSGTGMSPVGLPETHDMCEPSQRPVCPEVCKAFEGVGFIAEHTRREEESVRVKEDWKYVAMVLDRLFLWIFTLAVLLGSAGIILQAPTLYDDRLPIDVQLSEIRAVGEHGQVRRLPGMEPSKFT
ncbi:UNVERIFIED_CONTAM: hypothetical protein RMT77_003009 [Armadillidium vulgare]